MSGVFIAHKVTRFFNVISERDPEANARVYRITDCINCELSECGFSRTRSGTRVNISCRGLVPSPDETAAVSQSAN